MNFGHAGARGQSELHCVNRLLNVLRSGCDSGLALIATYGQRIRNRQDGHHSIFGGRDRFTDGIRERQDLHLTLSRRRHWLVSRLTDRVWERQYLEIGGSGRCSSRLSLSEAIVSSHSVFALRANCTE